MRLDLKKSEQIFEGNEGRFFSRKLVSFILLKMDFFRIFGRTLSIFPNFIVPTEEGICRLFIVISIARFSVIMIIVLVSSNVYVHNICTKHMKNYLKLPNKHCFFFFFFFFFFLRLFKSFILPKNGEKTKTSSESLFSPMCSDKYPYKYLSINIA